MITIELLNQQEALKDLTEDQKNAIKTLSENDENRVIADKVRELYNNLDKDIKESTGIEKERPDQKTYDYLKYALGKVSSDDGLQKKYDDAMAEIGSLKEKIKDGSGADALKKENSDLKSQLEALRDQVNTTESEYKAKLQEKENEVKSIMVDQSFESIFSSLEFKDGITDSIKKAVLDNAKRSILNNGEIDQLETDNGKLLVVRDKDGNVKLNPKNLSKPYSLRELVEEQVGDIVKSGDKKTGAGSGKSRGDIKTVSLNGAKTRQELMDAARDQLAKEGMAVTQPEYHTRLQEMLKENGYSELPASF